MPEKTLIAQAVEVICLAHTNYRRAGIAFQHGENRIESERITSTQLEQLKADPRLKVTVEKGEALQSDISNIESGHQPGPLDAITPPSYIAGASAKEGNELLTTTVNNLIDAIQLLDPSNTEHFTTSGKPQVDALSELMGVKVSATERDQAWGLVQAEPMTQDEKKPMDLDTEKGE
ncbi:MULTISPECIES: HI1506-related protein [Vibrio]|jgi:hypothetical protein|uniref:HI1506-related protein n=1 Tax=Vibrio TaxID=662 RepID=UPI000D3BE4B1|nr:MULTISPECIES: HI1506-related protein [Vibrio]PTP90089.1 hypothetical protein CWO03_04985 [Vibrio splendidus]